MLPIEPFYRIKDNLIKLVEGWKKEPANGSICLEYGTNPFPWADMSTDLFRTGIPLPTSHSGYHSWDVWFIRHLEQELAEISEQLRVPIYYKDPRGTLKKLERVA